MNYLMVFEEYSTENLSYLLSDKIDMIGTEKKKKISKNITLYIHDSVYGSSNRFVYYKDNVPVSAIQVMKSGSVPTIANVYTLPEYRRKGYATALLDIAEKWFGTPISHSPYLSDLGKMFRDSFD